MNVTLEEITAVNRVQTEIMREFVRVCDSLGLKYYMVHGSLLGTVMRQGFMPFDDDIDVAMPREDYARLLAEGQRVMGKGYFVQSFHSDPEYPLEFAKIRDSRTTYVVEAVSHLNINHGIYIDVFPIDNAMESKVSTLRYKLMNLRVGRVYKREGEGILMKIKRAAATLICPTLRGAVEGRDRLLTALPKCGRVRVTGGKATEGNLPFEWFGEGLLMDFEGMRVRVPSMWRDYLSHIYGDYEHRTLIEGKMEGERVILNASAVDVNTPYTVYLKENGNE